jgi:hypothetical protein
MMLAVRAAFQVLAFALTLAVAVTPVVFDGCLMTCQGVTAATPTTTNAGHNCHHAAGGLGVLHRFSHEATPCNHEHGQTASLSDETRSDAQLKAMPIAATSLTLTLASLTLDTHAESLPPRLFLTHQRSTSLVLPLRL